MTRLSALTVVIPHYGDPAPTLDLVRALGQQVDVDTMQIVVSDDASDQPFPVGAGYEVVRRSVNGGFGAAVNSGIDLAEHSVLLVINSDVQIDPHFVRELLDGASPWWPAVVAPRVRHPHGEAIVARTWPTVSQHAVEWFEPFARFHGRDWLERLIGNDVDAHRSEQATLTDWVIGVCMLLPTQDVRAVGGFDERFFMNSEEIDLQRRLHDERGLPVVALAAPCLSHLSGGSSDPDRRGQWLTDARFRYHHKWVGGPQLLIALRAVSRANQLWNRGRELAGRHVDTGGGYAKQRRWIDHGWRSRRVDQGKGH